MGLWVAIKVLVNPGAGVFERLDVGEDGRGGDYLSDFTFDRF